MPLSTDTLVTLSENRLLVEIWKPISIHMQRLIVLGRERLYQSLHGVIDIHRPVVEAIAAGDADLADTGPRRHVSISARNFLAIYQPDGDSS